MSVPIALRGDFGAAQLRGLARKTKDGPQAWRLLALAAIYDGATRTEAAKIGGVGLQIIRDWVMRFTKSTRIVQLNELPASWRPNRQQATWQILTIVSAFPFFQRAMS
jgi:hypothetical protein